MLSLVDLGVIRSRSRSTAGRPTSSSRHLPRLPRPRADARGDRASLRGARRGPQRAASSSTTRGRPTGSPAAAARACPRSASPRPAPRAGGRRRSSSCAPGVSCPYCGSTETRLENASGRRPAARSGTAPAAASPSSRSSRSEGFVMRALRRPPRVRPGDTVAIVSPSFGAVGAWPHRVERGTAYLEGLGLRVRVMPNAARNEGWASASPADRVADLVEAGLVLRRRGRPSAGRDRREPLEPAASALRLRPDPEAPPRSSGLLGHDRAPLGNRDASGSRDVQVPRSCPSWGSSHGSCTRTRTGACALRGSATRRFRSSPSAAWTDEFLGLGRQGGSDASARRACQRGLALDPRRSRAGVLLGGSLETICWHLKGSTAWVDPQDTILFLETSADAPSPATRSMPTSPTSSSSACSTPPPGSCSVVPTATRRTMRACCGTSSRLAPGPPRPAGARQRRARSCRPHGHATPRRWRGAAMRPAGASGSPQRRPSARDSHAGVAPFVATKTTNSSSLVAGRSLWSPWTRRRSAEPLPARASAEARSGSTG